MATVERVSVRTSVPSRAGHRLLLATLSAFVVTGALLAAAPSSASAQATNSLQSITPADGESVDVSPAAIVLSFNQELKDDDAPTLVLSCNNEPQNTGLPEVDADRLVVTFAINTPLRRGSCSVAWTLRDGLGATITDGSTTFAVLQDPPASATTASATGTTSPFVTVPAVTPTAPSSTPPANPGSSGGAVWLGRLLSTIGILVVFGGLALISVGWPEGPEYVVTVRFLRSAWLLSLAGTVLYLIAFASDYGNVSFGSAVNPSAWLDLNDAGWAGRGALLRLVFIGASGWVAMRPERIIDPTSAMWAWAIPGFALIAVAMSRVAGPAALVGLLVNIVHVLAVAVWFGGAALVARVVLAGPGEDDLVQATRAFSRVSVPAMLITAITGVIQVIRLDGGDLFTSNHGRVLLLKVIAVAAMLAVALAARQQVTMRLDRAHELTAAMADRFRRAFHAEAALGVVVLAFSGWLLALTPPNVDPYAGESYLPALVFNDADSGLQARVFVGPGRAGPTGLKVEVEAPADGISDLRLRFVPPAGSNAFIIQQAIPLTTSGTAILDDSEGLPLNIPGTWTLQVFAATTQGVLEGAERTFALTDVNGNFVTIPPATQPTTDLQVEVIDQPTTTAGFATTTTLQPPSTAPGTTGG
jgi:copper transport protein